MFYTPTPEGTYYPRYYSYSSKYAREEALASFPSSSSSSSSSGTPRAHPQSYSSMRRSRTVGGTPKFDKFDYDYDPSDTEPYARMPHTYAWVLEQQIAEMAKENEDTVRWVHEQQHARDASTVRELRRLAGRRSHSHSHSAHPLQLEQAFDALLLHRHHHAHAHTDARAAAWAESERWWKRWEQREAEFTVQDELRRVQAYRREAERHRVAYERRKRAEEEREKAKREREREARRARRQEAEREAGRRYEARWGELLSSEGTLGFRDVPWPMFSQPRALKDVSPAKVATFVLSPLHPGETRREKIRNALKRWHPDRFGRVAARVGEEEREAVDEGVGIVARCLNDLLERESQ